MCSLRTRRYVGLARRAYTILKEEIKRPERKQPEPRGYVSFGLPLEVGTADKTSK